MLAPSNPLSFRMLHELGGSTINGPSDLTIGQIAEMRAVSHLPIDLYVETPDAMGGIVRGHEAAELIAVAAPQDVKFGLRNSRLLYPSGAHLVDEAAAIAREKVHRAAVALEWIARSGIKLTQSLPGATGLGVPGVGWSADLNREVVLSAIEIFGPARAMFASNFPVDRLCASFDEI